MIYLYLTKWYIIIKIKRVFKTEIKPEIANKRFFLYIYMEVNKIFTIYILKITNSHAEIIIQRYLSFYK